MKVETLNSKRRTKLILLCKEFFPELQEKAHKETIKYCKERKERVEDQEYGFRLSDEGHNTLIYCTYPFNYDFDEFDEHLISFKKIDGVHWYHFCLTELPKKISEKLKKHYNIYTIIDLLITSSTHYFMDDKNAKIFYDIEPKHPVDFLWDFVQECKKNKYFK